MASYTMEQRKKAREANQRLITLDAGGLSFVGGVDDEEHEEVTRWLLGFIDRHRAKEKANGANGSG